jgi:2-dehydropantoate 2-reductase
MHFAVLGSGAVGGYYGAKLARAGYDVTFLARGAHLRAIRERGLLVWSPLGDFLARARAEEDPSAVGQVDVVLFCVKTYDNSVALQAIGPLMGPSTVVLTLQNGVDSATELAAVLGEPPVLAGATYIATALALPGLIEQIGTHQRVVFGEAFGLRTEVTERVARLREAFERAAVDVEAVPDARVPVWQKLAYLAPFAGFTGAARLPLGPLWKDPFIRDRFLEAVAEVERLARAEEVAIPSDLRTQIEQYMDALPPSTRSSLLIDLSLGKRLEVESLQGSVVRRARAYGVDAPIMATLYAVLKPHEHGRVA